MNRDTLRMEIGTVAFNSASKFSLEMYRQRRQPLGNEHPASRRVRVPNPPPLHPPPPTPAPDRPPSPPGQIHRRPAPLHFSYPLLFFALRAPPRQAARRVGSVSRDRSRTLMGGWGSFSVTTKNLPSTAEADKPTVGPPLKNTGCAAPVTGTGCPSSGLDPDL